MEPSTTQALFGCALHEKCTLAEAARVLGLGRESLQEAIKFRIHVMLDEGLHPSRYGESIEAGVRRLAAAN
jgi:hypothetical protein